MASRTRLMKRRRKSDKSRVSTVQSLPKDLLVEVLARVASSSLDDLFSTKLSCKEFNQMAQDDYIFAKVTISKFPLISWRVSNKTSRFLKRCRECGNAEALYRKGMRDFFGGIQLGIECLKKAASKGHIEASYVYGALLVCCGGDSKKEGLDLLYSLNHHKSRGLSITECRERIKDFIWSMWVDSDVIAKIVEIHEESNGDIKACSDCGHRQDAFTIERGWDYDDHDKFSSCNSCKWNQEVNLFCDILCGQSRYKTL